jgi:hypothetical protein
VACAQHTVARQRLVRKHELAAAERHNGRYRQLDAELLRLVRLALANAFGLGRILRRRHIVHVLRDRHVRHRPCRQRRLAGIIQVKLAKLAAEQSPVDLPCRGRTSTWFMLVIWSSATETERLDNSRANGRPTRQSRSDEKGNALRKASGSP